MQSDKKGYLAIFTTISLFSTIEVAVKLMGTNSIDPMFLAFLRFFVAGIFLTVPNFKKLQEIDKKDWVTIIVLALIGLGGTFSAYHYVLPISDASKVALIFSMNPIFASIFAIFILNEKLTSRTVVSLILGFIGVYIVSFGFKFITFDTILAPSLMVISAIGFGFYTTLSKKVVKKYGATLTTGIVFVIGSLTFLPFINSFTISYTKETVAILIYLIFFTTLLGYILYFYGLKKIDISIGTLLFYLKPIFSTILAIFILHEKPNIYFYIGMIIIFIALINSSLGGQKNDK